MLSTWQGRTDPSYREKSRWARSTCAPRDVTALPLVAGTHVRAWREGSTLASGVQVSKP